MPVFVLHSIRVLLAVLNPAQHRLLQRHVERAVDALEEADRLLKGAVGSTLLDAIKRLEAIPNEVDREEERLVRYDLDTIPFHLVPYLGSPFAQALAFNRYCDQEGLSHTKASKQWEGGNGAVTARNLLFLPSIFGDLYEEGLVDKTRLVAIANRNLTDEAYDELARLIKDRRKEDIDERLLRVEPGQLKVGRRGPAQALEAATTHGWDARFAEVDIPEDLVEEAGLEAEAQEADETVDDSDAARAARNLRAGLGGAKLATEVVEALALSPSPLELVEKFLTGHKKAGDNDPEELTKTLFFAHAGPMQRLVADDKLLLRHFRPVKTQKRGQLFYRVLEVIEEALLERSHRAELDARGIEEPAAKKAVAEVLHALNQDPNRFLEIPDEWLGEVTRRHLYFGSRTRKEGAAYKWFRKIGTTYYLGGHKTAEEVAAKQARKG